MSNPLPRRPKGCKTASSAEAAELVVQTGAANAFTLFQLGFGPSLATPDVVSISENTTDADGEYIALLRRLVKRDPTTKVKALQQLQRVLEADPDDLGVVGFLLEWCQLYPRLAVSLPKQIRENIYFVKVAIFGRSRQVKKAMERHIRQVIGPWVCNLCDPERDVRAAALQAWTAAFPDDAREVAALKFCRHDLFSHFARNVGITQDSLKTDQKLSTEEADHLFELVLSSSLLAAGLVLRKLEGHVAPEDFLDDVAAVLTPQVWRAAAVTGRFPGLRVGLLDLLLAVVRVCPGALADDSALKSATKFVLLDGFAEKESAVAFHWWPALVSFLRAYPQCWRLVPTPGSTLMPRLFALLRRTSGLMSLETMYQSLLPLVLEIPAEVLAACKEGGAPWFTGEFLTSLWKGIHAEGMLPTAVPALVDSYVECWKYFALTLPSRCPELDVAETEGALLRDHLTPACLYFLLNKSIRATSPSVFTERFGLLLGKLGAHRLGAALADSVWSPLLSAVVRAILEDRDLVASAGTKEAATATAHSKGR